MVARAGERPGLVARPWVGFILVSSRLLCHAHQRHRMRGGLGKRHRPGTNGRVGTRRVYAYLPFSSSAVTAFMSPGVVGF
jgi:hypothetical protein